MPDLSEEFAVWQAHKTCLIAGVDEAGRGAWAGSLVAAAVILPLPDEPAADKWQAVQALLAGVNDSKQLSHSAREKLFTKLNQFVQVGVGIVSSLTIDFLGVGVANRLAWQKAIAALPVSPQFLLLDAFKLPEVNIPQKAIVKGDTISLSIAAASIIAKVTRDHLLQDLDRLYPLYGLAEHKGYGTARHSAALRQQGPCPIHRYSYAPVWQEFQQRNHATRNSKEEKGEINE
jgi:ribonuclease HII